MYVHGAIVAAIVAATGRATDRRDDRIVEKSKEMATDSDVMTAVDLCAPYSRNATEPTHSD